MLSSMIRSIGITLCLSLMIFMAPTAAAQTCPDLDGQPHLLGTIDGVTHLAATPIGKSLVAAVTNDSLLVVYRQQMDGAPVLVGNVQLPGNFRWIASLGKFVYVAGDAGVRVFKINKDGRIQFKGELEGIGGTGQIKSDGERLVMVHDGAWSLWDCSERATPAQLARIAFETNSYSYQGSRIALGGDRVAIDGTVYDISRPTDPAEVGQVPTDDSRIADCEIVGDFLYEFRTTSADGGSWIYGDRWYYRTYFVTVRDLNDTQWFEILVRHNFKHSTGAPMRAPKTVFAKSGSRILAGQTHDHNTLVIDTTAPADATPLWVPVAPNTALVHQDDQLVGIGVGMWAFAVPETSIKGRVTVAAAGLGGSGYGTSYTWHSMNDVAVAEDLVAVIQTTMDSDGRFYWDDWTSIKIYQPGLGTMEAVASIATWHTRVALIDGFLLSGGGKLYASDISDPAVPGEPVLIPGIEGLNDLVALDGRTIAVGDRDGGFIIYDLTDPGAPALLGTCDLGGSVGIMSRDGDKVLVTIPRNGEIVVVDVSDRAAPQVCTVIEVQGTVGAIAGHHGQGLATMRNDKKDYQVEFEYAGQGQARRARNGSAIELSRPVSTTKIPLYVNGVVSHGQSIFGSGSGLHAYSPAARSYVGSVATSHYYFGVASCENRLYGICYNTLVDVTDVACEMLKSGAAGDVAHVEIPLAGLNLTAAPNPFNPMTQFSFTLVHEQLIKLAVFDLKGRRVRELASGTWLADRHIVNWNGRDDKGREMSSGIYFVRLQAGPESVVAKVMLVR